MLQLPASCSSWRAAGGPPRGRAARRRPSPPPAIPLASRGPTAARPARDSADAEAGGTLSAPLLHMGPPMGSFASCSLPGLVGVRTRSSLLPACCIGGGEGQAGGHGRCAPVRATCRQHAGRLPIGSALGTCTLAIDDIVMTGRYYGWPEPACSPWFMSSAAGCCFSGLKLLGLGASSTLSPGKGKGAGNGCCRREPGGWSARLAATASRARRCARPVACTGGHGAVRASLKAGGLAGACGAEGRKHLCTGECGELLRSCCGELLRGVQRVEAAQQRALVGRGHNALPSAHNHDSPPPPPPTHTHTHTPANCRSPLDSSSNSCESTGLLGRPGPVVCWVANHARGCTTPAGGRQAERRTRGGGERRRVRRAAGGGRQACSCALAAPTLPTLPLARLPRCRVPPQDSPRAAAGVPAAPERSRRAASILNQSGQRRGDARAEKCLGGTAHSQLQAMSTMRRGPAAAHSNPAPSCCIFSRPPAHHVTVIAAGQHGGSPAAGARPGEDDARNGPRAPLRRAAGQGAVMLGVQAKQKRPTPPPVLGAPPTPLAAHRSPPAAVPLPWQAPRLLRPAAARGWACGAAARMTTTKGSHKVWTRD